LLRVALVGAGAMTFSLHQCQTSLEGSLVSFDHIGDDKSN
jgi:hypothetical protein